MIRQCLQVEGEFGMNICMQCMANESKIVERNEIFPVKGQDIEICSKVRVCTKCGEDIFDEELDGENLENAYNIYRKKNGLLMPEEIKQIRDQYGLSQRAFSSILGWGEITMHRYETGALQDSTHNNMLCLLKNPENMLEIIMAKKDSIKPSLFKKLISRIGEIKKTNIESTIINCIEESINKAQDEYCGYTVFDYEKVVNLILFFASHMKLFKTKLMKLLFYADFIHFKRYTVSITGLRYIKNYYGPTPEKHDLILGEMADNYIEFVPDGNNFFGEYIKTLKDYDQSMFSEYEMEVIQKVVEVFKDYSAKAISEYSHDERAWVEPAEKEYISYKYAKSISLD